MTQNTAMVISSEVVSELNEVSYEDRDACSRDSRGAESHSKWMQRWSCLDQVRHQQNPHSDYEALEFPITVAAWNLERCYHPLESSNLLRDVHIALLSELDVGMARTSQVDTVDVMSEAMNVHSLYAVEFVELGIGNAIEIAATGNQTNSIGFHGNALLCSAPMQDIKLWRWMSHYAQWFAPDAKEPRIGTRCAVGALIPTAQCLIGCISLHLEYNGDSHDRERDTRDLIQTIMNDWPNMPLIIGGDFNTNDVHQDSWEREGLFKYAIEAGFDVFPNLLTSDSTTRPSTISPLAKPARLDWILTRGLLVSQSEIRPALDASAHPLSDHECVIVRVEGLKTSA